MDKRLIVLGLLLAGPQSGYRLHQIAAAHGDIYRDLKKANLYYLLERMAEGGLVSFEVETGARGPRRERVIYSITDAGREEFARLLGEVLRDYQPAQMMVEIAIVLLEHLPARQARAVLEERLLAVEAYRKQAATQLGEVKPGTAADHLLLQVDAEASWLQRALGRSAPSMPPRSREEKEDEHGG